MNEIGHDGIGRGHGGAWAIGVVAALVVYVLSPPPLAWIVERTGVDPPEQLFWIYYPLEMAYDRLEPVKKFYKAYGQMIGVDM